MNPPLTGAIRRVYCGVEFRSTTEAKFALFLDRLGVAWTYEPEGYTDGLHQTVPDFWIPSMACFVEVKHRGEYDRHKPKTVARVTGVPVYVLVAPPWSADGCVLHRYGGVNGQFEDGAFCFARTDCGEWCIRRGESGDDAEDVLRAARAAHNFKFWDAAPAR